MAKSPVFTLRLPQKDREALDLMAKVYGAPSSGGFVAEMISTMCSGDVERVKAFVNRLILKHGEQMALQFNAVLDAAAAAADEKPLKVLKPAPKVERSAPKRGRSK